MKPLLVIPVYNEVETLHSVLERLQQIYRDAVLLVDDGSSDGSCSNLKKYNFSKFEVITHNNNIGYGAALKTGFDYAVKCGHDPVITMDCDEQHEPCRVPTFIERIIDSNADIISGSRYLADFQSNNQAPKDIFNWKLTDSFCGFKAYRLSVLSKLNITENGYGMPLQVWIQLGKAKAHIEELAVPRIYQNLNRSFGAVLDDPQKRLQYYEDIIKRELQ
jgi:glycosyltransferase involved in cell wall biosynthesis